MALQRIPGCNNHWLHESPNISSTPALSTIATLDAAADRITMIGGFAHQDGVSKTVDGVEFCFGTVSKANLSTMQVSLQDVDLVNGPVIREDGTPDQTLTIANADAGYATGAWYGGDFDGAATRTLAIGELVAVVFQFGTFFAGDTVGIKGMSLIASSSLIDNQNIVVTNLSGTYANATFLSNVIFRCSDGTFGTLENAWPCKLVNAHSVNVATAGADEYALGVQMPFPQESNAVWVPSLLAGPTMSTEYLLYNGTTALRTITIDHNALNTNAAQRLRRNYPPQIHAANTLYRVAIRPTGTTSITVYSTDVNEVGHMSCLPGGAACHLWTRVDQGAWGGEVTTRRLLAGIRLNAFDDGAQDFTQTDIDNATDTAYDEGYAQGLLDGAGGGTPSEGGTLANNRWILDTPGAAFVTSLPQYVKSILWDATGLTAGTDRAIITDENNEVIWEARAKDAVVSQLDLIENWWHGGFKLPTLAGGTLIITVE